MNQKKNPLRFCGNRLFESRFFIAHPSVILLYFVGVMTYLFLFENPVFRLSTVASIFMLSAFYVKKSEISSSLKLGIIVGLFVAIINPLTNHRGVTTLFYLGNIKITLESLGYGVVSGITLVGMLLLFAPFNVLINSERFLYLFSKVSPKIAFITSMTLRFIPTFSKRATSIVEVALTRGISTKSGNLTHRVLAGRTLLETLFNSSLEDGMDIGMVLKTKSYGKMRRTSYKTYAFRFSDGVLVAGMLIALTLLITAAAYGLGDYSFFPQISLPKNSIGTSICYTLILLHILLPLWVEVITLIKRRFFR